MILASGLAKSYSVRRGRERLRVDAVSDASFEVAGGEIVSFLGPNGAGKTTTLRMLTTLTSPTSGSARVAGHDVAAQPREVRRQIGYVSQGGSAGGFARAGDDIVDRAMLYGLDAATATRRARALLDRLDLADVWTRVVRTLSGGQRRRLDVAMGLVHKPRLLFLDEPTASLDPQARANLWGHIRDLREEYGMTVFLTTHYLDEADVLSDRVIVFDHGRVVTADTPDALKDRISGDLVEMEVADPEQVDAAAHILEKSATDRPSVTGLRVTGRVHKAGTALPGLARELGVAGIDLVSLEVRRPTLDDVFLTLTGRSLRDSH
ncbi:ATP-binding cassette domain-containing protein [Streptomyces sp. NL15-2K]|uniref:ATP-binding cassette domain-containing protein n=1 Tax=Streptomyces sp. NL15-2K TaxID=376149 RepID=UPI000F577E66|nr:MULTISPECIES: ATP-binding cassette domain-containing protein [Actinomycetes]WKX07234.1 ATP-binding cassette domain-containing protein [Kutzneria buriramensis]GCB51566.1 ATPase component of ABC-type multidrug transport system [Streptomyces sp. NL15-2K]